MELNHYGDTILGVVPTEDIVEGRMVCLTSHSFSPDFGSKTDLPGVKLPAVAADSVKARYVITFAVDNRPTPIYDPTPQMAWSLRYGGFDQAANVPFTASVLLTHPGNQEGKTIASGVNALAFGEGIYTVPSGSYVYSASLAVPGCSLDVCNTNQDGAGSAGKLKAGTTAPVAETIRYDSTTGKLTFKILH